MRVGIDVGGTFTDLVALDEKSGSLVRYKVPTTPRAPEESVVAVLRRLVASECDATISLISHSSTIATNALLGQLNLELPRVALLTTHGFRDVLEIGRQNRAEIYNLFVRRPRPLVDKADRLGIYERLDPTGAIVTPLDAASLQPAIEHLVRNEIRTVAVSFLHAYANPIHERAAADAIRSRIGSIDITLSSEIDPEPREYERTSTAVVNAALTPLVRRYLANLEHDVRDMEVKAPIYVMQSNGGMVSAEIASRRPAAMIESGPASGAIGAAFLGRQLGIENILSFDMGGTTAKAGTIFDGEPQVASEFEAAGKTHSGRAIKGSGYPVRFPFIDLAEVSAGGGTIAWIDAGETLRVGPFSAGADPGPAAYGFGMQPTVTDANIVLGRLNSDAMLGGELRLDATRSREAIGTLMPYLPGLDLERVAYGIVQLVDNEMAKVLRIVSIERGHDPRTFTMLAFGGGGPLHACAVAESLEVERIIVPVSPGLFSAWGLLAADVRASHVRTISQAADTIDPKHVENTFHEMQVLGEEELRAQNVADAEMRFLRELEMRYFGQSYELTVLAPSRIDTGSLRRAVQDFHTRHERTYGYASREDVVEIVAARLVTIGVTPKPAASTLRKRSKRDTAVPEISGHRYVYLNNANHTSTPIYKREHLLADDVVIGPAIIEEYDSTTLVASGWNAEVDSTGNLHLVRVIA